MILGQQRTQPNNHYSFNKVWQTFGKMQKQHFSSLFVAVDLIGFLWIGLYGKRADIRRFAEKR